MPVVEHKRQCGELVIDSCVRAGLHIRGLHQARVSELHSGLVWTVVLLLAIACSRPLSAQGLGDEVILSRLGDPVEIEIALKEWQQLDMSRIKISNATRDQYQSFKLTYLPVLDSLSFNVVGPNQAGEVKILVSSRTPVAEPYMDLLLVMKWPEGSSMREYVLLFDPPMPNFSGAGEPNQRLKAPAVKASAVSDKPAVVADKPTVVPDKPVASPDKPIAVSDKPTIVVAAGPKPEPKVETKAEPKSEPKSEPKAETKTEPTPKTTAAKGLASTEPDVRTQTAIEVEKLGQPAADPANDGRRQYRVRNGDSLWNIARQFHPAGIGENLYQFLISLHDLNRDAFINGNISLLKADAPLHIPSARDIASINPGSAQKIFEQLWRDGVRSPDASVAGDSPQFKALNEPAAPKQQARLVPAPKLPPGTELQNNSTQSSSPLLPAPTAVVQPASQLSPPLAAAAGTNNEPARVQAITVVPLQTSQVKPAVPAPVPTPSATPSATLAPTVADGNPLLQKVNASASAIQGLLEVRQQRLQALEQQILAVKTELQLAQSRATELNQGASSSLEARRAEVTRKAIQLGLLAAVLLILLGTTLRFALKWHLEIRRSQGPDG